MNHRSNFYPYRDCLVALWENKRYLPHAWNILTRGVCDDCSLGSFGLRDPVLGGLHLCAGRLESLRLNTIGPLKLSAVKDARRLQALSLKRLRSLGRLPQPMIRRKTDRGFSPIPWSDALDVICRAIHDTPPHELGFCAAPCGVSNEVYYVLQKLARTFGTNNIDLCSGPYHAAGVSGLQATLGSAAATCSLSDLIDSDLLVILEPDLATQQPATNKYLQYARKRGTRIVAVKPVPEPEFPGSCSPSEPLSPEFGTKLIDDFFNMRPGGEIAFINGVLKALIAGSRVDHKFIARHTRAFDAVTTALNEQSWDMLEHRCGAPRQEMERFAKLYGGVSSAVFVYGTTFTQHEFGTDNVKAVVNLALARGMVGREKCGILPIRGTGGMQGGSDCGAEPDRFPGGFAVNEESARRFSNLWRHPVPSTPGLRLSQLIEAAHRGRLKFLYAVGGDFLDASDDRQWVTEALSRVPVRIHQDIVLNRSALLEGAEAVLVLPAQTRYEQEGGGTTTSTERRIFFTPEITGPRIGESLAGWQIPTLIGRRSMPNGDLLFPFTDAQTVREEMARVMPIYQGIERFQKERDYLQWGGPHLFKGGSFRGMPEERALFSVLEPPDRMTGKDSSGLNTSGGGDLEVDPDTVST
ncbi:MAG: molybdopterin-dependent oxidoreductase [Alphaproteobacteria bacterium]